MKKLFALLACSLVSQMLFAQELRWSCELRGTNLRGFLDIYSGENRNHRGNLYLERPQDVTNIDLESAILIYRGRAAETWEAENKSKDVKITLQVLIEKTTPQISSARGTIKIVCPDESLQADALCEGQPAASK